MIKLFVTIVFLFSVTSCASRDSYQVVNTCDELPEVPYLYQVLSTELGDPDDEWQVCAAPDTCVPVDDAVVRKAVMSACHSYEVPLRFFYTYPGHKDCPRDGGPYCVALDSGERADLTSG